MCPECATLLNQITPEKEPIRSVVPQNSNLEYFDGYIKEAGDDSGLFRDSATPIST